MSFDYHSFNPSQYLSELTKAEWKPQEGSSSPDLQLETVDHKAKDILGILQEKGISAQLSSGSEGITSVIVPKKSLDKLREAHSSASRESELEVDVIAKAVRKHSDSIREWKEKNVSELALYDLTEFKSLFTNYHKILVNQLSDEAKMNYSELMSNFAQAEIEREENTNRLFKALSSLSSNKIEILTLMMKGVNFKQKNKDETLLTVACKWGADKDVVQHMIRLGADASEVDLDEAFRLFLKPEVAELLIENGADIEKTNSDGETALFTASNAAIKFLISKGVNVNHVDHQGDTALNHAIQFYNSDLFQALIDGGSDVRKANFAGRTPLSNMLIRKSDDLDSEMNYFISKGYGPELIQQFFKQGGSDANVIALLKGMTSKYTMDQIIRELLPHLRFSSTLHLVGLAARNETAHQFLEGFMVALMKSGRSGGLPLLIQRNDLEHLQNFFIEGYKICSPELQQEIWDEGNLFLVGVEEAIEKQNINTEELWRELAKPNPNISAMLALIEKGVNTSDIQDGKTLLIKASENGLYDIMEMLLQHGADVDQLGALNRTALVWASQLGDRRVIDILINNGANVNHADKYGTTPLHEASRNENVAIIEALLDSGADFKQLDNKQRTPLHRAAKEGKLYAMLALISRGADLYHRDIRGISSLNELLLHESQNRSEIIKYLVEKGFGTDLLMATLQYGGKEENLNTLLKEVFQKDSTIDLSQLRREINYIYFHKLVEQAQNSELIDQFLDRLMQAFLSNQWVSNSGERQSRLEQQPFIFYPSEDPAKITVEVQGRTPLQISKNRFYKIWVQEYGDPVDIGRAIFAPPKPSPGAYDLEIERSLIGEIPLQVLAMVSEKFREALHDQFSITFAGEVGQDIGGLGRQFVNQLFASAAHRLKFNRRENGLYRPQLVENSEGDFPPLINDDRKAYRALGELMFFFSMPIQIGPIR